MVPEEIAIAEDRVTVPDVIVVAVEVIVPDEMAMADERVIVPEVIVVAVEVITPLDICTSIPAEVVTGARDPLLAGSPIVITWRCAVVANTRASTSWPEVPTPGGT
jgi:hypothetical protein